MIIHKLYRRELLTTICLLIIGCAGQQPPTFITSFDGAKINYTVKGAGSPAIVFVHGWLAEMTVWDRQLAEFSKTNTVVALDLPGFGKSSLVRSDWTMANYGKDVAGLIRQLGLEKVILVGHSMGAAVVLEAALALPDEITGVVVVDNFRNVESKSTEEEISEAINARAPGMAQIIRGRPDLAYAKPAWIGSYREYLRWYGNGLLDGLRALRVPIYAINSDHTATNIDMFRKYAPSFKLTIIEGVGHVMMPEAPKKFNTALREIMAEW